MERADAHFVESGGGIEVSWVNHVEEGGGTPAVPGTYTYIYLSESTLIWGVPLYDGTALSLDAGPAVSIGGGIVGLPCTGHPFIAGESIRISNSTNYNATYTLTGGTSANQLQFLGIYTPETFNGTERIVKMISSIGGAGRMVQDSDGNLYMVGNWDAGHNTYAYKIETDGTIVYDFLNHSWPLGVGGVVAVGLAITPDDQYLYIWFYETFVTDMGYMEKYDLTTGDLVWQSTQSWPGYDIALDSTGNVYAAHAPIVKFDAATGDKTNLTTVQGAYETIVDDDLGIVIGAGGINDFDPDLVFNLWVRKLDDSAGDSLLVGGCYFQGGQWLAYTINSGCAVLHNGFIYCLISSPTPTLYKVQWGGTNLSIVDSAPGPDYGVGLFFDLWGNLVVINQDWIAWQTDVFYYYDEDLNYLTNLDGFDEDLLKSWASVAGGSWIQGNGCANGDLGTPEVPGTENYWQVYDTEGSELLLPSLIGEEVAILADGVVMPNQIVDDNGRIDCSGFPNVKKLHWGLAYESKLKPMKPVSQPDMMSAVVTCKEMGISVHNTDDIKYGVHDDDMHDINFDHESFKNKSEIDGLFTGTVAVNVPDGFSVNLPLQITTSAPLPATVRAMIPKVD